MCFLLITEVSRLLELPGSIRSFKVKKEDFYSHLDSFLVLQNRQKVLKVAAAA